MTPESLATTAAARSGTQAIERALAIMGAFDSQRTVCSATQLAAELHLPLSTTHRIAQALAQAGLLEQGGARGSRRRYRLGPEALRLGRLAEQQFGLDRISAELADLALRTQTTVDLACLSRNYALVVAGSSVDGDGTPFLRLALHSTALGKVLLAWPSRTAGMLDDPRHLQTLGPLVAHTSATITETEELREELHVVRENGYAVNDGESANGVRTLAVPVLDPSGHARYALAARATPELISNRRLDEFLQQLRASARTLALQLLPPVSASGPSSLPRPQRGCGCYPAEGP